MRFAPWQVFVINDCDRPLPNFLNKIGKGLLFSISFCPADDISKGNNILWNIDLKNIHAILSCISGKTINISWNYKDGKRDLLNICKFLHSHHVKNAYLTVSNCSYKCFILYYIDFLQIFLKVFGAIIILNENDDELLLPHEFHTRHIKRRRPCKYPFECITIGRSSKLFPCPYSCEKNFEQISSMDEITQNKDYLLFLSAHLCGILDEYPFCLNCEYWLDGWLGEEKEQIYDRQGNRFNLLWERHSCTITKINGK